MTENPKGGDLVLGDRYELLQQVKGSLGGGKIYVGTKGRCCYCGNRDASVFRNIAHTFPEALGNKWVFSQHECDGCNARFSLYEDALVKSVSPFLTLGGVKGKGNKTRQTGRTKDDAVIARRPGVERPQISMFVKNVDPRNHIGIDPGTGKLRLNTPVADVPFTPRHAYKALTKMGIALLPPEELGNYQKLRAWLLDPGDDEDFANLEVAMSFASVGNAPALVVGTLLRRVNPMDVVPHILFIFSAGSICLQIDLMSDHMEDHLPPVPNGAIRIKWANVLSDEKGNGVIRIEYSDPMHLNWSSRELRPQPIESLVLDFCPTTCEGRFTPIFRN